MGYSGPGYGILSLAVSEKYIWCLDYKGGLFCSALPGAGLRWQKFEDAVQQVAVSPSGWPPRLPPPCSCRCSGPAHGGHTAGTGRAQGGHTGGPAATPSLQHVTSACTSEGFLQRTGVASFDIN